LSTAEVIFRADEYQNEKLWHDTKSLRTTSRG
jgi:hypothetical protein